MLVHLAGTPAGKLSPLLDAIVQAVDVRTGLVTWEWHALGHIPLAQSYATPANSASYDAYHINAIQPLGGGRVLVSARDTSAVYEVDRASGRILLDARRQGEQLPARARARASGSSTTRRCSPEIVSACSTTRPARRRRPRPRAA